MSKKDKSQNFIAANQVSSNYKKDVLFDDQEENLDKPDRIPVDTETYLGIPAKVAKSTIYIRNTRVPNWQKYFMQKPLHATVDYYFPHAEGGELYLDTPETKTDLDRCKEKVWVMREERKRYAYITEEMDVEDVLTQLKDK